MQKSEARQGSLLVVGVGIQSAGHASPAAVAAIRGADHVFYAVVDPWTVKWLAQLNQNTESLPYPLDGSARSDTYAEMVQRMLARVRAGQRVCGVFYGHPSFLADAARQAVRQAREEGFPSRLVPGISAFDCLCADLGFDPLARGCLLAEAGEFLRAELVFDSSVALALFQIAVIDHAGFHGSQTAEHMRAGLQRLGERLMQKFPAQHRALLYEAATLPTRPPRQEAVALAELANASVNDLTTLFVPALPVPARSPERVCPPATS